MKRLICMIIISSIMLSGCSTDGEWIKEPVTFYYVHENYQKDMEQVIVSEVREASGHMEDLPYLLALYSMGPSKEGLASPLPRNTRITLTERSDETITLSLSESGQTMTDVDFTLASSCIAMTCMELTGALQIMIVCGERTITIQQDNLMLHGSNMQNQKEDTT